MPAYAAGQPVVSREGVALSVYDGGTAVIVPHEGHCLSRAESARRADTTIVAGDDPSKPCRTFAVPGVLSVHAGEVLRLEGKRNIVEVDPLLVESVQIRSPNLESVSYAPETRVRSAGMIVGGSLLMAAGIAGSIALFTAAANVEDDWFSVIPQVFLGTFGVVSLGAGFGGGVPLVVFGARPVRVPQSEQPVTGIRLGGLGLRWAFE
jgi:hypothetical protein